ncbi:hypothetical protein U472_14110 [Orenia metallireducens]|uniref:Uncharacterized protein n=1 Tax=Orenia metallireducens TaxID=1413210 RepID=A0A1C0A5Q6_9FIRM|nr:DUF5693 family protein [Orenia metallireducens]OCL25477.1 hypothetical protein U472_14110 [Orenia metallireducens]
MKRFLSLIVIVGLLFAIFLITKRHQVESTNRDVELVMDYSLLAEKEQVDLLIKLKELGVNSVAFEQESLRTLDTKNRITYYSGRELNFLSKFISQDKDFDIDNLYITGDNKLLLRLKDLLVMKLGEGRVEQSGDFLVISDWEDKYLDTPLYFDTEVMAKLKGLRFNLVPRVAANNSVKDFREMINRLPDFEKVIFSGDNVVGYPEEIKETAKALKENGMTLGVIEPFIAYQLGANQLARRINLNAVRVHSLQQEELAKLGVEKTTDRYFKAVYERNVRVLYLKPFDEREDTIKFIKVLAEKLHKFGYHLETAKPFRHMNNNEGLKLIVAVSIIAIISLVLTLWSPKLAYLCFGLGTLVLVTLYSFNSQLILELMALKSAIIFPLITFIYLVNSIKGNNTLINTYNLFIQGITITLCGGVLIEGLLADREYLLQVSQFRGIKLAFLLPLILSTVYYLYFEYGSLGDLKKDINKLLTRKISIQDVIIISTLIIGGIIYLIRTGNNPIIPVTGLELQLRALLEDILVIRPRFKSFLLGHPLLILGIYLSFKEQQYLWLLLLGLIGQITILNTFSHLHTPFIISLIRVLIGVGLGGVIGGGLIGIVKLISRYRGKSLF